MTMPFSNPRKSRSNRAVAAAGRSPCSRCSWWRHCDWSARDCPAARLTRDRPRPPPSRHVRYHFPFANLDSESSTRGRRSPFTWDRSVFGNSLYVVWNGAGTLRGGTLSLRSVLALARYLYEYFAKLEFWTFLPTDVLVRPNELLILFWDRIIYSG